MLWALLKRELRCAFRKRIEIVNSLFFFILIVTLFSISLTNPEEKVLQTITPGIICVAILLSTLLSLERLFTDDFHDGSLEQLLLLPYPTPLLVLVKIFSHWLTAGLPLILVSPIVALLLSLGWDTWLVMVGVLFLSTPALSLIGAVGAALTVNLKKGSILLSLIIIPLYIPTLIFSAMAINLAMVSLPVVAHLALLGAISTGALTLMPFFIASALKINLQ